MSRGALLRTTDLTSWNSAAQASKVFRIISNWRYCRQQRQLFPGFPKVVARLSNRLFSPIVNGSLPNNLFPGSPHSRTTRFDSLAYSYTIYRGPLFALLCNYWKTIHPSLLQPISIALSALLMTIRTTPLVIISSYLEFFLFP